jgi:hypothetical protein
VNAPRELIGASGAKLTEMPWHADRGLCCGAGGARMWMEEHIGKRVNHERVEEALDTCASKIATGCPFCRVMMTDGVDDVAAANGVPKAEVLDVAQLLLGSLDKSSVTLPEKGTAAKAAEERAARVEASTPTVENKAPVEAPQEEPAEAKASTATETKPVTGLGIAGGAKRPGTNKAAAPTGAAQPESAPDGKLGAARGSSAEGNGETPMRLVKGLRIAKGTRPPGRRWRARADVNPPAGERRHWPAPGRRRPLRIIEPSRPL